MNGADTVLVNERVAGAAVSRETRTGLGVLGAAVGVGIAGDLLLRSAPWGINLTLFTFVLVGAIVALQRWAKTDDVAVGWIPLALGAAALMAWRDSPTLKALTLSALVLVVALAMLRARGGHVRLAGLANLALGVLVSVTDAAVGTVSLLTRDVRWKELGGGGWPVAIAVLRGTAIGLPLLLVFGLLLSAADAAFERLLGSVFGFDLASAVGHVLLAAFIAWLAGGVLRTLAVGDDQPGPDVVRPAGLSLGMVEVGTALGMLNALFLAFVLVQLPYFFGGAARIQSGASATFSEYARRGFFELVAVAGLVLPLLLLADWIVRREKPGHERAFRLLVGMQVALLFVIMASGLHRMRLYWGAYGLTELRLYTTAFMVWLGVVFAWFAWTVLRGHRQKFAWGALMTAVEMMALLHVANPDAMIVRVNASRADAATHFDAIYAARLSADAVPPLLAALRAVDDSPTRCHAAERLLRRWEGEGDWRSWSLSRGRASAAVALHRTELRSMACPAAPAAAATALPSGPSVAR
ncbi:MAG TPA: DUF4173 domain-containing protein [Longimicrobium sp.]|nr:DUF4173 domain-containing protein [Longimicrobium sp.]